MSHHDNESTTEQTQISDFDQNSLTIAEKFPLPGDLNQVLNQIENPENVATNENETEDDDGDEQVYDDFPGTGDTSDPSDPQGGPIFEPATIWTRKDIKEFKDTLRKDSPTSIIKIGHGETATIRVPTHANGTKVYWEFATDYYDLGFGVYFEWSVPDSDMITVQITESDDEDDEEEGGGDDSAASDPELGQNTKEEKEGGAAPPSDTVTSPNDVEGAAVARRQKKPQGPPIDEIMPIYRRDCHEEVHGGSHTYPGQGVYLLKFDNTYSLWRSKCLYYRVYYGD